MELKQLIADDNAVSPVIGVILMVAITVILAAVIGTFVLGIGQDQQSTPQAQFDFSQNTGGTGYEISHQGGDTFTDENTGSLQAGIQGSLNDWSSSSSDSLTNGISAGSTYTTAGVSGGDVLQVRWEAPGGGDTQIIADFTVP